MECEFPRSNASSAVLTEILSTTKTIAVVGLSPKPDRPSHQIARYLMEKGFSVVGVNPGHKEILGLPVYPTVADVPHPIDMVNIFLRPENVPPVVEDAIKKGVRFVWMQEGIVHNDSADKARQAGLSVVMNKCIYKELQARS